MSERATEAQLDALHEALCRKWQARLDDPEPLTAAEYTALAKFLKDNNITVRPGAPRMNPLQEGLDALDEEADDPGVVDLGRWRTGA